jgi:hypothetical protein
LFCTSETILFSRLKIPLGNLKYWAFILEFGMDANIFFLNSTTVRGWPQQSLDRPRARLRSSTLLKGRVEKENGID